MKLLSEGTKSWLFGCHSIIHSYYVIKAWEVLYKRWPKPWQIGCILLHDIGYCGTNYLTDKSNNDHAELGAWLCKVLFGKKGFELVIAHSRKSASKYSLNLSQLEAADDFSWIIASDIWLDWNKLVEPKLVGRAWKDIIKENWKNGLDGRGSSFDLALNYWDKDTKNENTK